MKIDFNNYRAEKFMLINEGEVFQREGECYMKIDYIENSNGAFYNAVRISDGELDGFFDDALVSIYPEATLVLEPKEE